MAPVIDRFIMFFIENFPPTHVIFIAGPLGMAWAYLCLWLSGYLKIKKGWKTGYTRKTFHFLIFTSVAAIQGIWGTPVMCLFGGMTSLVILYALIRGPGSLLYEAMARETDEPHRTFFIIVPYLATLIGGVAANILVGQIAILGYLTTGFGDAVGEPVGTRFGAHKYKVPSMLGVNAWRSLEGSFAVFAACLAAIAVGISLCPQLGFSFWSFLWIPLLGMICMVVEAVTPHGWDNATLQIVPAVLATVML